MGDRKPLNARVDEDVIRDFREYTREQKGSVRGEFGRLVERALIEYMDNDRYDRVETRLERIEEKVDAISRDDRKKKKDSRDKDSASDAGSGGSESTEKIDDSESDGKDGLGAKTENRFRAVRNEIRAEADGADSVHELVVEKAIENNAGTSAPTIRRYKRLLQNRGEIFANPRNDSKFFIDREAFVDFVDSQVRSGYLDWDDRDRLVERYFDTEDAWIRLSTVDAIYDADEWIGDDVEFDDGSVGFQ